MRAGLLVGMELISVRVKIEVAIPVSYMEGVGGRTPRIAGEVWGCGCPRCAPMNALTIYHSSRRLTDGYRVAVRSRREECLPLPIAFDRVKAKNEKNRCSKESLS